MIGKLKALFETSVKAVNAFKNWVVIGEFILVAYFLVAVGLIPAMSLALQLKENGGGVLLTAYGMWSMMVAPMLLAYGYRVMMKSITKRDELISELDKIRHHLLATGRYHDDLTPLFIRALNKAKE